jgi:hypothetical protein
VRPAVFPGRHIFARRRLASISTHNKSVNTNAVFRGLGETQAN